MAKQSAILQNTFLVYSGLQKTLHAILLPPVREGEDLCSAPHWKDGTQLLGWDETQLMCLGLYLHELGFLKLAVQVQASCARGFQTLCGTML